MNVAPGSSLCLSAGGIKDLWIMDKGITPVLLLLVLIVSKYVLLSFANPLRGVLYRIIVWVLCFTFSHVRGSKGTDMIVMWRSHEVQSEHSDDTSICSKRLAGLFIYEIWLLSEYFDHHGHFFRPSPLPAYYSPLYSLPAQSVVYLHPQPSAHSHHTPVRSDPQRRLSHD